MVSRRGFVAALAAAPLFHRGSRAGTAAVEILYQSPDGHPNALEDTPEGLWVGEQVTDAAYLLDWKTGKVLRKVETESSNTSGLAFGGGFLWMGANGPAVVRPARPHDAKTGEIVKVDPATGRTVARFPIPGGGGVHGLQWAQNSLWVTTLALRSITRMDAAGTVLHSFPVTLNRAHGLGWDGSALWCMFSNDRVIQRLDPKDGRILKSVQLSPEDPDPHGMTWFRGDLYYTDAGISPGAVASGSKTAGSICRIRLK
jgi:streptogramin lyase